MKHALLLVLAAATLFAADATGKWSGTLSDDNPGPALLILKQEGTALTGTAGPNANERHDIQNGKADNGKISFEVPVGDGGVLKFVLVQDGDQIKGQVTGERRGQVQTATLAVKREK